MSKSPRLYPRMGVAGVQESSRNYSMVTGVLSGFCFVALVMLVGSLHGSGAAPLALLFVAFVAMTTTSYLYAAIAAEAVGNEAILDSILACRRETDAETQEAGHDACPIPLALAFHAAGSLFGVAVILMLVVVAGRILNAIGGDTALIWCTMATYEVAVFLVCVQWTLLGTDTLVSLERQHTTVRFPVGIAVFWVALLLVATAASLLWVPAAVLGAPWVLYALTLLGIFVLLVCVLMTLFVVVDVNQGPWRLRVMRRLLLGGGIFTLAAGAVLTNFWLASQWG